MGPCGRHLVSALRKIYELVKLRLKLTCDELVNSPLKLTCDELVNSRLLLNEFSTGNRMICLSFVTRQKFRRIWKMKSQ